MNEKINLEMLEGKWYINQSNFPMWLKGDKLNPTFNYSIATKNGIRGLNDEVIYSKNKQSKSIVGFDTPANENNTAFVWRGKGILSMLKSEWQVLYFDAEIMLIEFKKTLFTPSGYDVVSRKKTLSLEELEKCSQILKQLAIKDKLTNIVQN